MQNNLYMVKKMNGEQLLKSLERLSIYDANGKSKLLKLPPKIDFEKMLGNLDLDKIDQKMCAK